MARRPDLERAARAVHDFLDAIGAPVDGDPELRDTGTRVAEAFALDLLAGYDASPAEVLAEATASDAPGLVVAQGLPVATVCPHHLMPAIGVAHVGYLPAGRVVGFGALGTLVDCYARRLALQEDVGRNVARALVEVLGAEGAACFLELEPTCMTARGGRRHGARTVTHAWEGCLRGDAGARAEVLVALGGGEGAGGEYG